MRQIKFKAKCLDNAEWVEGYYIKKPSYHQTPKGDVVEDGEDHLIFGMTKDDVQPLCYEVDPSTVCQFTGLADKNGKEIWEGDYLTPINDSEAMKVIFKEGSFGFDTSYYGMRFHPLAQYDIREGNKLVELILINRKEGEK